MGIAGDVDTAGGGRVIIIADSINFTGLSASIQANAKPFDSAF